jgi:GAF domain-containing protein
LPLARTLAPLPNDPIDATDAFSELGRIKLSDTDLVGVLGRIAELAKQTLRDAAEVSVTLIRPTGPQTAAFTGQLAIELDEYQYEQGHGPCLSAAQKGDTFVITDMATETRWPDWTPRALRAGAGSSLSIGLPIKESVNGALNVYSTKVGAFDEDTVLLAQTFVGYALVALANAHLYDTTANLASNLQAAMDSRAIIEQAKGIIMGERRCSSVEAFAILAKLSSDSNRKLRDVATALVESATNEPGR